MAIGRYKVHLHVMHEKYQQKDTWHTRGVVAELPACEFYGGEVKSCRVYYYNYKCKHWKVSGSRPCPLREGEVMIGEPSPSAHMA